MATSRTLQIAILVHNIAWRGGAFYHGFGFAKQLAQRGHDVTLLAIAPTARWEFSERVVEGVRVVETPDLTRGLSRSGWDPWNAYCRLRWLRKRQFDLIHCVDTRPAVILPAIFRKRHGRPKVITDWTDWFGRGGVSKERPGVSPTVKRLLTHVENFFEERFHGVADGTVVISERLKRRAEGLRLPHDRLTLIRPGTDIDVIRPMDKVESRKRLGLNTAGRIIGHLGALAPSDTALLKGAMLRVKQKVPTAELMLIGNHRAKFVDEEKAALGLRETSFVPAEDIPYYLAAADVLVLPLADSLANQARWPSKIHDYVASGRATVSTTVGDIATLIKTLGIGLVADPTPDRLSEALLEALSDPRNTSLMEHRARQVAETELSWPPAIDALETLYYRVLSS